MGGALEARDIPAGEGRLRCQATGEIGKEDNVLVIRRIHVQYHLKLEKEKREAAQRVLGFHADYCPVVRTLQNCIEISTSLEMEDLSTL